MDDSKQVFTGKSGKLVIGRNGISIERNYSQASQNKTGLKTQLNFSDIESMHHRYAGDKPGYIELKAKAGSTAGSGINRRHRIHFDAASAHRFRRAQKQIARKLAEESSISAAPIDVPTETSSFNDVPQYRMQALQSQVEAAGGETTINIVNESTTPLPPPTLLTGDDSVSAGLPYRKSNPLAAI